MYKKFLHWEDAHLEAWKIHPIPVTWMSLHIEVGRC